LPYPKIKDYLKAFFGLELSTAGLSSHVIAVSGLMKEVYEEIPRGVSSPRYLKASLKHHIRTGKPLSIEAYSRSIHADFDMKKAA
jgi:hypothetical protein